MSTPELTCRFELSDTELLVFLTGEINYKNVISVREQIDEKIQEHSPQSLVIDMADVPFMDSSGLGLILGRYNIIDQVGGSITITNPSKNVLQIFNVAGLHKVAKIINKKRW